jgi:hypothetical protein
MHPLSDNLKSISFDELEKRSSEIMKRMQIARRSGMSNPAVWDQLHSLLDAVTDEKMERASLMNHQPSDKNSHVIINTDPIDDDMMPDDRKTPVKPFTPIS